ncbi:MAG: hypothetical protein ACXVDI_25310 [Ktedonobacterales bacterium]
MNTEIEACLIKYIADEWRSLRSDKWATSRDYSSHTREATLDMYWNPLPEERWPWGVWIRQHGPLPASTPDIGDVATPLHKAWFLSEDGLRQMNPWSFLRYWTVQFTRPWASAESYVEDAAFARPRWRIGYASFAEITSSDEIYLETLWGGRWGWGRLVTTAGPTVQEIRTLWIA